MARQTSMDHYSFLNELDEKSPFIQEDNHYQYEDDFTNNIDEVTGSVNWNRAAAMNENYAKSLGWIKHIYAINDLLLQATGQYGISLHGEAFAQAVAAWQQRQGFSAKDADGIIGPNTWRRMQPMLNNISIAPAPQPAAPTTGSRPSPKNIFDFNKWHAQRILDKMKAGIFGSNFNSRLQLEKILRGEQVLRIDPNQAIIKVLPIIDHIGEQAANENYTKIIIGSFIRDATNGKCTGHCAGRCIDINYKDGNFNTSGSVEMVIKILNYLLSLPQQFKRSLGFGMPQQGNFFGNQGFTKFKSVSPSRLLNAELRALVPQLGIVFPDNDNHLHIQVNWELQETETEYMGEEAWLQDNEFEDFESFGDILEKSIKEKYDKYLDKIQDYYYSKKIERDIENSIYFKDDPVRKKHALRWVAGAILDYRKLAKADRNLLYRFLNLFKKIPLFASLAEIYLVILIFRASLVLVKKYLVDPWVSALMLGDQLAFVHGLSRTIVSIIKNKNAPQLDSRVKLQNSSGVDAYLAGVQVAYENNKSFPYINAFDGIRDMEYEDAVKSVFLYLSFLITSSLGYDKKKWFFTVGNALTRENNGKIYFGYDVRELEYADQYFDENEENNYYPRSGEQYNDEYGEYEDLEDNQYKDVEMFEGSQDFENSFDEYEDPESSWLNAIEKNRKYSSTLGWSQYHDRINNLLLPYSGQQNVSLAEEAFAQAVAAWQQQQGFAAKDCDGIIGPNTWARMRSLVGAQPTITTSPTQVSTLPAKIDSNVVTRLKGFSADIESISKQYGIDPNIVRGIIAAESGGNPDSGKGTSGYKGLMQAERTTDQLQPGTSIQTGVAKFILFRDKILNPWFVRLRIPIPTATDEIYLKACLSCYNAGPVTAIKAIQYAHLAGNWREWLSAEYYLRALLFSGGYAKYKNCNQGLSDAQISAASAERLKYKFKNPKSWRTEPDPPAWSAVVPVLNPVTRCWIETKFNNSPGYLDRFIEYFKYFEANPQPPQPEVTDESSMYGEYDTPLEIFDDEGLEIENSVSFEDESYQSQENWVAQDNEDVFGHEEWEDNTEMPSPDHESFVEQILQFLKPGVVAENVKQFLNENYFNFSLIARFASGEIWNEDYLALEILFHRNPKLKPALLDKLSGISRLGELHRLASKHKRVLKPLVDSIVRPLFGNPANFQIPPAEPLCKIQDLRPEIRSLRPLKGRVTPGAPVWYKRNAARSPRILSMIDSIVIHHMGFNRGNDVRRYNRVGAQYIVMADGQIAQLYDDLDYLNSSNSFNPRSIAIEFAGNFPDTGYTWLPRAVDTPDRCYVTPAQIRAGRCLLSDLKTRFPGIKYLYAHRQSSNQKPFDSGPDIWFNIAEWAINKFGLTDRLPKPNEGTGQSIPDNWRLARPISLSAGTSAPKLISKEDKDWNEAEEDEIELEEYALQSDESLNEESYYNNEMEDEMFEDSGVSFEMDEQITNWSKAIELNRSYGVRLGWNQSHDQINDLLLPYSGQQNVSLSEVAFAQAVAAWQQQQGLTADGVIGPTTWSKMKVLLKAATPFQPVQPSPLPTGTTPPPVHNIFDFNRWYAKRIVDTMNAGFIGTNFNSKDQLEKIIRGEQVLNVNPQAKIIQILPIMYHIAEQARSENYREIIFGSFVRPPSDGKCTGHCVGKCIDINHIQRSFETSDATQMVIRILKYLLSLPVKYKSSIGFGMPLQGNFFGHKSLLKFKGTDPSNLIDTGLQTLVRQLGYIFPDNDNHIHIQVNWLTEGLASKHEVWGSDPKEHEMENFTLAQKIDMVRSWKDLLLYKVPDKIVQQLRKRDMYVQYAHNQSYSNDLNTDFYSVRILQYPTVNGVQMNAQSLIKYIRLNINSFVDTSYCDFKPYNPAIDTFLWKSDNPLGTVLKLDIKGPDNASVVVSWVGKYGWQFSTIYAPDTGEHPVSGHREFYIINKPSDGGAPIFAIKGLDMMSTGVAGLGFPILGAWGFGQGDALWKSMQSRVLNFINSNSGKAIKDEPYSERVEWRFVYRQYRYLLEQTFGKGAGSAENSSFFNFQLESSDSLYENV